MAMSERLDRIEAVLDKLAEQKEADQQAMAEFRAAVASLTQVRESDQQENATRTSPNQERL
ncbi:MAG: hypothetical protein HC835_09605, partial [Oscillatoriales cyanobacterium RM2_1_1]|nr:hypothetical protein [Oscillatoriales cyanobacterium RM2_1_1]